MVTISLDIAARVFRGVRKDGLSGDFGPTFAQRLAACEPYFAQYDAYSPDGHRSELHNESKEFLVRREANGSISYRVAQLEYELTNDGSQYHKAMFMADGRRSPKKWFHFKAKALTLISVDAEEVIERLRTILDQARSNEALDREGATGGGFIFNFRGAPSPRKRT